MDDIRTPSPSPDLESTIDAAVAATSTVERSLEATALAREEATRQALPTSTPVVMTVYAPTPEPFVASPGSMERGIEEMYVCLQEHEEFRALFVASMEQQGLSLEAADVFVQAMIADKDFFAEVMLESAGDDPSSASLLALIGEMVGQSCDSPATPTRHDLGMSDSEVKNLVGEFYDCYHSDPGFEALFATFIDGDSCASFATLMLSDRDLFTESFLAGARQDPHAAEYIAALDVLLETGCR